MSIHTRAMPARAAILMAAFCNFAGAFASTAVAATLASGIVDSADVNLTTIYAALVAAIAWNIASWWWGMPASSSHALIGGLVGAAIASDGFSAVIWSGIVGEVVILALFINGTLGTLTVPLYVIALSATAIALGTAVGGWRVIKTVGARITKVSPLQGFAAQGGSAVAILASAQLGYPLSTTQVVSGAVLGAGAARSVRAVRWGVAKESGSRGW